jgi:hypothetical protein
MEEEISLSDFKGHRANIEAERSRLNNMIESIRQRQHLVKADFEVALELATQFDFLMRTAISIRSDCYAKQCLMRLYIEDGNITKAEYNAPFTIIARASGSESIKDGGRYWI